jgi:hypothetical protein
MMASLLPIAILALRSGIPNNNTETVRIVGTTRGVLRKKFFCDLCYLFLEITLLILPVLFPSTPF